MNRDEVIKQLLATVKSGAPHWVDLPLNIHGAEAADLIVSLEAKLAKAERVARYETDIAQQALDQMRAAGVNKYSLSIGGVF